MEVREENMDIGEEILMGNFPPVVIKLQTTCQVSFTHSVQINSLCVKHNENSAKKFLKLHSLWASLNKLLKSLFYSNSDLHRWRPDLQLKLQAKTEARLDLQPFERAVGKTNFLSCKISRIFSSTGTYLLKIYFVQILVKINHFHKGIYILQYSSRRL
jgi:hypothetical protein